MSNELSIPNLADTIRDRVRTSIVSVIPDEQIDNLVKAEYGRYFQAPQQPSWEKKEVFSPFQSTIKAEIESYMKEKLQAAVQKELDAIMSDAKWTQTGQVAVSSMVKQYAPDFLEGMIANYTNNVVGQLRNAIASGRNF